jgi:hypothetical protein
MRKKCGGKKNQFGDIVKNLLTPLMILLVVNRLKEVH